MHGGLLSLAATRYLWGCRPATPVEKSCHDRQDELPRLVHRAGHAVQERRVDEKAFRDLVDWQIAEGTNGLVPVGTTGESPTLSHDEHKHVVEWCVDQARRPGAGGRRRRLEFDRRGDRSGAARREGRRRRGAGRDALLQQADPGRALPALQGDQRRHRHSDHHLQHSRRARSSTCRSTP